MSEGYSYLIESRPSKKSWTNKSNKDHLNWSSLVFIKIYLIEDDCGQVLYKGQGESLQP